MSADTRYVVVADSGDEDGLQKKRPIFTLDDQQYFHGDDFIPPAGYAENMTNFSGRGVRFNYSETWKNEEGKKVTTGYTIILPLRIDGTEIKETPVPAIRKPKTPKAV